MEKTIGVFSSAKGNDSNKFITREVFPNSLIADRRGVLYRGYLNNICIVESHNLLECVDSLNLIFKDFYDVKFSLDDTKDNNTLLLALYSDKVVKRTRGRVSKKDNSYRLVGIYDSLFYFIRCLLNQVNVYNNEEIEETLLNIVLFYNRYMKNDNDLFKLLSDIKGVSIDSNNNSIKIGNFTIIPYDRNGLDIDICKVDTNNK